MPATLHLDASQPADILRAADLLRSGHLVAFATETVYGLGANALDPVAVAAIFTAKQRPAWDPLIVHLASASQLSTIATVPTHLASRVSHLASSFWPGPLTLLLPRNTSVPDAVTAGRELVGIRVPAHPAAHALLAAFGLPVAAPSANTFGHTSPTTTQHVLADLEGRIAAVLDAGPTTLGLESTVIDPTQTPMVLYRPGAITPSQLTAATGVDVIVHQPTSTAAEPHSLPSPGVGIRHYAPSARLVLVDADSNDLTHSLLEQNRCELDAGHRVGALLPDGWAVLQKTLISSWGSWDDPNQLSRQLYASLRSLDDCGVDVILCPLPVSTEHTAALRDRLTKAARPA